MNQILVIAWREISRLRKRFGGNGSPIVALVLMAALGFSAFNLRDSVSLGNGLYRVGVSGDVPAIEDSRFSIHEVTPEEGQALLADRSIDVLIVGATVFEREDDKSQFAVRALKQYMEVFELERVAASFDDGGAFPLRVGVNAVDGNPPEASVEPRADVVIQTVKPEEIIIPSITPPPAPFTQVLITLIYILPITFISIFFTSSFMDEKANRRLTVYFLRL